MFNARIYLFMSAQGINWNRKWNVDTSYVLCDRGLYNLPSLVSVADPHFWDPEAWNVMGTPSQPATIGQHIARYKMPYCPCKDIEAQMVENGIMGRNSWKCAIQWVYCHQQRGQGNHCYRLCYVLPWQITTIFPKKPKKNNYYISEFD